MLEVRNSLSLFGPPVVWTLSTQESEFRDAEVETEGFLRPSIPDNGGIRFHPDHSMDETFLNDSTDHMKSR